MVTTYTVWVAVIPDRLVEAVLFQDYLWDSTKVKWNHKTLNRKTLVENTFNRREDEEQNRVH
jgi:hypothetical protein